MINKKGLEFSFAWIFAILVGAMIIFLAIYAAVKIVGTSRFEVDSMTAKQLTIVFEPLETGVAEDYKPAPITLKEETRIYNQCFSDGSFGRQKISLASSSGFVQKWQKSGVEITVPNKYIFSNATEQGKIVYYFSKPFYSPWKVSELIFLTTEKYCLQNIPNQLEEEISFLGFENIATENCTNDKYVQVCFESGINCSMVVYGQCQDSDCKSKYDYGYVDKKTKNLYFTGNLMFGAIFSDKESYECNVKRVMKRLQQQTIILKDEADFISDKCGSSVSLGLAKLALASRINNSQELIQVYNAGKDASEENSVSECRLW